MATFSIQGGSAITGTIPVYGAKNSALKLVAASLLTDQQITITNVPDIIEIQWLCELIKSIGGSADFDKNTSELKLHTSEISNATLPEELVRKTRSAILLVGPIIARHGKVRFSHPGGCALGKRPIDFFLNGFEKMGAQIIETGSHFEITAKNGLKGCEYFFPKISHTATESLMTIATLATGTTILHNAACEPEVVTLAQCLNMNGAKINGAGTPTIIIEGVKSISGGQWQTIPDRLETGTFAILGALCGKELTVTNCEPKHLLSLWNIFETIGIDFSLNKNSITVKRKNKPYKSLNVQTHEYPGFPTDLQPPLTVLLTQCEGMSLVHETIFDGRLFYTDLLHQMGADIIMCDPHRVIVNGPTPLYGRKISSPDIRAGIALVMAAMIANGQSVIDNIYQIDRGYADLQTRLSAIGANITRAE